MEARGWGAASFADGLDCSKDPVGGGVWVCFDLTFPQANYSIPFSFKIFRIPLIARLVALDLTLPIRGISGWRSIMRWTAVPETPVHKYGYPRTCKQEIWTRFMQPLL